MSYAVETRDLTRVFAGKRKRRFRRPKENEEHLGPVTALDGVSIQIREGELFGMLGPNGAGKTTLIKILTTLLLPSAGTARVFGFDVERETKQIRRIMNMVAGGEQSGYGILTVREQLWMFTQFYGLSNRDGWRRVDELIEAASALAETPPPEPRGTRLGRIGQPGSERPRRAPGTPPRGMVVSCMS